MSYPAGHIQVKLTTLSIGDIGDITCCGINGIAVSCVGNKCCAKAKLGGCGDDTDCCDSTHICGGGVCCAELGGACSTSQDCCNVWHECTNDVCTES